jgi:dipeptidyl aminopeptidase/acylaminoacyl peptidase
MKPSDIGALLTVGEPAVSPDGHLIAFVVTRVDEEANDYRSQVWLAAADGASPPRAFTAGEHKDGHPTWSPDGSRLAFTAERGEGERAKTTLHVAPVDTGGEVLTLARLPEGAADLRWSPDGRHIAFTTRTRAGRYDSEDERRQPPRRLKRLFSRLDNVGFTADRPEHLYIVDADGTRPPRNLTPGEFQFTSPEWTPNSSALLASAAAHDTWDLDLRVDIYTVDLDGRRRAVTGTTGQYVAPSVSPDGSMVAFVGTDDADTHPRNMHVGIVGIDGGEHRWISLGLDRTFQPFPDFRAPHWLDDSSLLVSVEDRGNVHLYRVAADGSTPPEGLWTGEGCVTGFDERAGTTALTLSTPTSPGELYVVEGGAVRRITDLTSPFAEQAHLQPYERITVPSSDGTAEIDAWILTPPRFDPAGSYPALINVHGGPFSQYANRFFDEFQIQAGAGYVVVWCNPRGSSGREESFGRAICGQPLGGTGWGSVDYDDIMAVVDQALKAFPAIDADRLGILGGSYGGCMTSWIIGHTDRFRAACSERAANNLLSLEWASDLATAFRTYLGKNHLEAPELYQAMSPITRVRDIITPLLIVHSENDLRCPIEQAEQMFVALRMLQRDVEFVRFPAESHELSRSGSPAHRRQRAEIILEFFDRHLKPGTHGSGDTGSVSG